jgi:hypothetical protein
MLCHPCLDFPPTDLSSTRTSPPKNSTTRLRAVLTNTKGLLVTAPPFALIRFSLLILHTNNNFPNSSKPNTPLLSTAKYTFRNRNGYGLRKPAKPYPLELFISNKSPDLCLLSSTSTFIQISLIQPKRLLQIFTKAILPVLQRNQR